MIVFSTLRRLMIEIIICETVDGSLPIFPLQLSWALVCGEAEIQSIDVVLTGN